MKIFATAILLLISNAALAEVPCKEIDPLYDADGTSCSAVELQRVDAELNIAYRKLLADLDDDAKDNPHAKDAKKALIRAQRAWVMLRDADCEAAFSYYAGGTIRVYAEHACIISHTKTRILQLNKLFDGTQLVIQVGTSPQWAR